MNGKLFASLIICSFALISAPSKAMNQGCMTSEDILGKKEVKLILTHGGSCFLTRSNQDRQHPEMKKFMAAVDDLLQGSVFSVTIPYQDEEGNLVLIPVEEMTYHRTKGAFLPDDKSKRSLTRIRLNIRKL